MPHMQKYTQAQVALIMAHNLRSKDTSYKSADERLEKNNLYYLYNGERLEQVHADKKTLQKRARERQKYLFHNLPHAKRKDLVTMAEWVVTCPKEIWPNDRIRFLKASMDFIATRYGVESITCAAMHLDEPGAMPHLHITFVPVDGKGRICARNVLTRRELQKFHPELEKYVSKAMGYDVHILREPEERTKESKPLSQYKAETMQQEAKEKMDKALKHEENAKESERSAEFKRREAAEKEQNAEQKLAEAQRTVIDARAAAVAAAANRTAEYQSKGLWDKITGKKDPIEYVRSVSTELETVNQLDEQQLKEREAAVLTGEQSLAAGKQQLIERSKELDKQQEQLEKERAEFAAEQQEAKEKAEKEAARVQKEQEKREKELAERLAAAEKAEREAADERKDAAEFRAEGTAAKEEANKQYVEAKILSDNANVAIKRWYADKAKWVSIEEANERYQDEKKRGDTYEQSSNNYYNRLKEERARADTAEQTVKQQKKEIASYAVAAIDKDNQIDDLRQKLEKEQGKSRSLETSLASNIEYATMLRAELRYKNNLLPVRPQTDTRAKLEAYQEQSDIARQKTGFAAKLEIIEPSPERVAEIKAKLLAKGIHRSSGKKPNGPAGGR